MAKGVEDLKGCFNQITKNIFSQLSLEVTAMEIVWVLDFFLLKFSVMLSCGGWVVQQNVRF